MRGTTEPKRPNTRAAGAGGDPQPRTRTRRGRGQAWIVSALAALILGGIVLWPVLAADEDSAGADRGVTLNEIVEDPRAFTGRQVTVSGEVADADRTAGVFTIGDDGRVIVLPLQGAEVPSAISEGDAVQVRGRVELMSAGLADAEEFGFDEDAVFGLGARGTWAEEVALVASSVEPTVASERDE